MKNNKSALGKFKNNEGWYWCLRKDRWYERYFSDRRKRRIRIIVNKYPFD